MKSLFLLMIKIPGDDLLSHGETPHYHRRANVSLLSSGWDQVVPHGYGRQEKQLQTMLSEEPTLNNLLDCYALLAMTTVCGRKR